MRACAITFRKIKEMFKFTFSKDALVRATVTKLNGAQQAVKSKKVQNFRSRLSKGAFTCLPPSLDGKY